MIVAGIDIGSRTAKAVLMANSSILSWVIGDTGPESVKTARLTMERVLKKPGLSLSDVQYTVATGYGRVLVPFANKNISEISCHARGINWYFPSVRTILDMGGQDCKAISCDGAGRVVDFIMNDKCAGGSGRFLEMIAEVLNVPLSEIGNLSLESENAIPFNTICAVFAKSEAVAYLRQGVAKSDILAGLNEAIATRSLNLLRRVSIKADFAITGGIAKNSGMVARLMEKVGLEPLLSEDPQIVGAVGAALFAQDRLNCSGAREMKMHYGYSDGSGDYFITIDTGRCDGCGRCLPVCPSPVFEIGDGKAKVAEAARNRLSILCPGFQACNCEENCHTICPKDAIEHTW
jgi:predicted CoA-substrate-specific enzyme activase